MNAKSPSQLRFEKKFSLDPSLFEIIYSIQVKRFACGYSTDDVSFLLGYDYDLLAAVERFADDEKITLSDMIAMTDIFGTAMSAYFYCTHTMRRRQKYSIYQYIDGFQVSHEGYKVDTSGNEHLLYKFFEDNAATMVISPEAFEAGQDRLTELLTNGFFEEQRYGFEIFEAFLKKTRIYVRPRTIKLLLQDLVAAGILIKHIPDKRKRKAYYALPNQNECKATQEAD